MEIARTVIIDAESRLRDVLASAARDGEYDALVQLTRWASLLRELATSGDLPGITKDRASSSNGAARVPLAKSPTAARETKGRSSIQASYPRFVRRGDALVKIGWSKKSKEEYQHKAPQEVLGSLSQRLSEFGRGGKLVSANDVTPLIGPDNSEIPDYQVYLCLAWLRELGLITQEGRQGYSIPEPGRLPERVIGEWERLASDAESLRH